MNSSFRKLAVTCAVTLFIAGCGGGDGGTASQPVAPVVASASAFTPSSAVPGATVTFTGNGFSKVNAVAFGGIPAQFAIVSDTQMTAIVPTGVNTSSVMMTIAGVGFSIQVASALVLEIPSLSTTSATMTKAGASIQVSGTRLDTVAGFSVGGVALVASAVTPTSATLTTPTASVSGPIVLTMASGATFTSAYQLSTHAPLAADSLSRNMSVVGDSVTIYGSGLDVVSSVALQNGAVGAITAQSAASITFTVPAMTDLTVANARPLTSWIILTTPFEKLSSILALTVGPSVTVSTTSAASDGVSTTLLVSGTNLSLITGASVGGVPAKIFSLTDTLATLTAPGNVSGAVVLTTAYQAAMAAGVVSTTAAGVTAMSELDFAQVLNKSGSDVSLRLTPNRPVLARAFITSNVAGTASPVVTLQVTKNGAAVGNLTMSGPSTLPAISNSTKIDNTFNVTVPAAWVTAGVSFKALATSRAGAHMAVTASPAVGLAARLHVVIVPLTINGVAATLPTMLAVHDALARAYPLASDGIVVTQRAAFAVTAVTGISSTSDAAAVLAQVETLRSQEDPAAFYYGMFAASVNTSTVGGIGYLGSIGHEASSSESAVGFDGAQLVGAVDPFAIGLQSWAQVMLHEIGHNHSLQHAPCGSAGNPDPSFPYALGGLGPNNVIYNSLYANDTAVGTLSGTTIAGGTGMSDMMGYCAGIFFSDYNYTKVQSYIEARTAALPALSTIPLAKASSVATALGNLVISGTIDANGVTMHPAHATNTAGRGAVDASSIYAVRVTTDAGQVLSYPVMASEVADADGAYFFSRSIPNPGGVARIDVLKAGKVIAEAQSSGGMARALSARSTSESPRAASWSEAVGNLTLSWNSAVEPFATVTHVANDGARTVLALALRGGAAKLSTVSLPAGGRFEISFSTSTCARMVVMQR